MTFASEGGVATGIVGRDQGFRKISFGNEQDCWETKCYLAPMTIVWRCAGVTNCSRIVSFCENLQEGGEVCGTCILIRLEQIV